MNDIIRSIEQEQLRSDIPDFRPGDTVRVDVKVVEGNKERIQAFEGVVIKRRGTGLSETFTVRRVAYGVAVERCFPIHSPRVDKIAVVRHGKVRRAKLYYMKPVREKLQESKKYVARMSGAGEFSPVLFY